MKTRKLLLEAVKPLVRRQAKISLRDLERFAFDGVPLPVLSGEQCSLLAALIKESVHPKTLLEGDSSQLRTQLLLNRQTRERLIQLVF